MISYKLNFPGISTRVWRPAAGELHNGIIFSASLINLFVSPDIADTTTTILFPSEANFATFSATAFIFSGLALWEFQRLIQFKSIIPFFSLALSMGYSLFGMVTKQTEDTMLYTALILNTILIIILFSSKKINYSYPIKLILSIGYLVFSSYFICQSAYEELIYSPWLLALLYLSIWSNNSFAYLFGSKFGKHILLPSISPKKSWEGFFGGMIATLLFTYFIEKELNLFELCLKKEGLVGSAQIKSTCSIGGLKKPYKILNNFNDPTLPVFLKGFTLPQNIKRPRLNYPRIAQKKGITGFAIVSFGIDEQGNTINHSISPPFSHEIFHSEALKASKKLKYAPLTFESAPIKYPRPTNGLKAILTITKTTAPTIAIVLYCLARYAFAPI